MVNWGNFSAFFSTGIPPVILFSSLLIMTVVMMFGILCKWINNRRNYFLWTLLSEYAFVVVCSTIICRGVQSFTFARLELIPFWTYKAVIAHTPGVSVWDIVLNIALFVPLGFLVKLLYPKLKLLKIMLIAVLCSAFIETNQYLFEKGIAQIDDVMHNTLGCMLGWGIAWLCVRGFKNYKSSRD